MLKRNQPLAIFMERSLGLDIGKMGYGVLRYSPNEVACVIDSVHAGKMVSDVMVTPRDCPVVGSIAEAHALGAQALILGIAPSGGRIPDHWFHSIDEAISLKMSVLNGLHERLNLRYPNLEEGQYVWDIRQEPEGLDTGTGRAMTLTNRRILMVGTDMAVGKMTTGLEILQAARHAGIKAEFVATGQIGITVTGRGIPLDAIRVDYACGAVETEVMFHADAEWIIVEGQGSLMHPGSTATLPLLRGSMPTDMILCMQAGQTALRRIAEIPIPPLVSLIAMYENLATMNGNFPVAKVRAIAMNSSQVSTEQALAEAAKITAETGLPVYDPIRDGAEGFVEAIRSAVL